VRHAGQGVGIGAVLRLDVGAGIDVGGRAEAFGNGGQGHALREQLAVAVVEGLHADPLEENVFVAFFGGFFVVRQVQRTFLATTGEGAAQHGEREEGKQQALHGVILCKIGDWRGVYRPPGALPMRPRRVLCGLQPVRGWPFLL